MKNKENEKISYELKANVIKHLILNLLRNWYCIGKTEGTLYEIFDELGVERDLSTENITFTINNKVMDLDEDYIWAVIKNQMQ